MRDPGQGAGVECTHVWTHAQPLTHLLEGAPGLLELLDEIVGQRLPPALRHGEDEGCDGSSDQRQEYDNQADPPEKDERPAPYERPGRERVNILVRGRPDDGGVADAELDLGLLIVRTEFENRYPSKACC